MNPAVTDKPRIPIAQAHRLAEALFTLWKLPSSAVVAGSIRRGRPRVADVELVVPPAEGQRDALYERISDMMDSDIPESDLWPRSRNAVGHAVKGLTKGFQYARVVVRPSAIGVECDLPTVPVDLFRWREERGIEGAAPKSNRGWVIIVRTGPDDFGEQFLATWKRKCKCPKDREISRQNWLLSPRGNTLHTPTEESVWAQTGILSVSPQQREQHRGDCVLLIDDVVDGERRKHPYVRQAAACLGFRNVGEARARREADLEAWKLQGGKL